MKEETFIGQKRFVGLWVTLASLGAFGGLFAADHPIGGRNGGTRLGVAYGILSVAAILVLMWYGVRKRRSYRNGSATLKGWLGLHVWLGGFVALLVPLHAGLKLHLNVHSAPYFIMLLTVGSGVWGVYAFMRFPAEMQARRQGLTMRALAEQIEKTSRAIVAMREGSSAGFTAFVGQLDQPVEPTLGRIVIGRAFPLPEKTWTVKLLRALPPEEYAKGRDLIALVFRRLQITNQLIDESFVVLRMRLWLYFHVPLSFACVLAVAAHVFWVLFYRWSAG